jgi:hypothetical protein
MAETEVVFHEKSHGLGASEITAITQTQVYSLKLLFSGRLPVATALWRILSSIAFNFAMNITVLIMPLTHNYSAFYQPSFHRLMALRGEQQRLTEEYDGMAQKLRKAEGPDGLEKLRETALILEAQGQTETALRFREAIFKHIFEGFSNNYLKPSIRGKALCVLYELGIAIACYYRADGRVEEVQKIKVKLGGIVADTHNARLVRNLPSYQAIMDVLSD